jgi:hypothetical protein
MAKSDRQADTADTRCPVCAAGAERGQLICLECGSRIALRHRRPPSWKVPVAIVIGVLVLASAGGVLAYEALDADARREADAAPPRVADPAEDADEGAGSAEPEESDSEESESQDSAEREPSLGGAPDGASGGDAAGDDAPATPDEAPAEAPAVPAGELVPDGELFTWPRTLRGFTVVVQSTEDRGSATTFARSVAESSDGQVGVISSADFQTIPEGFFVVFVGRYDGRPGAERAAVRLGRTYPGAFPQAVRR